MIRIIIIRGQISPLPSPTHLFWGPKLTFLVFQTLPGRSTARVPILRSQGQAEEMPVSYTAAWLPPWGRHVLMNWLNREQRH